MNLDEYYVYFKIDEQNRMIFVNDDETLSYSLHASMKFNTKDEALEAANLSKENHENDEFSYMHSGYNIYEGCSVGKVEVKMSEIIK